MLLLAVAVLSVMGLGLYLVQYGMNKQKEKYEIEILKAQERARIEINEIQKNLDRALLDIYAKPDNGITCPYATDGIRRLYNGGNSQ